MATKTLYFKDAVPAGATLHRSLQDGGTAPTAITSGTGWTAGTNAAGQSCTQVGGTEVGRLNPNWGTPLEPNGAPSQTLGDCWRSENTINGIFANTDWTINFRCISVTAAYTGRFKMGVRLWRSTNENGVSATEITSGRITSSATSADLGTVTVVDVPVTFTPGRTVTLTNEYLFMSVGVEITTAATSGITKDILFRINPTAAITTPDFSPIEARTFTITQAATQTLNAAVIEAKTLTIAVANSFSFVPGLIALKSFSESANCSLTLAAGEVIGRNLSITNSGVVASNGSNVESRAIATTANSDVTLNSIDLSLRTFVISGSTATTISGITVGADIIENRTFSIIGSTTESLDSICFSLRTIGITGIAASTLDNASLGLRTVGLASSTSSTFVPAQITAESIASVSGSTSNFFESGVGSVVTVISSSAALSILSGNVESANIEATGASVLLADASALTESKASFTLEGASLLVLNAIQLGSTSFDIVLRGNDNPPVDLQTGTIVATYSVPDLLAKYEATKIKAEYQDFLITATFEDRPLVAMYEAAELKAAYTVYTIKATVND